MLWHYRYRLNGKQEQVTLGRYPALSLKLARAERDKRETLVAQGQSPAVQKRLARQGAAPDTTVAEFGERFFRDVVAKDRRDLTIPRRYFDKSIVPAIGTKAVRDVTTEDVRDYAQTAGLVTTNPVLALPMRHVHKAKARERALSPDEIRTFLKAAFESNIRRQFKIGLHLILLTMVRKSELLLARWEHVDFEQAEWHIPAEHSKTGKPHIVFLSRQAVALFRELHALAGGSELVMPGRGSLTKPFAQLATAAIPAVAGRGSCACAAGIAGIARPPAPERGPSPGIRLSRPAAPDSPPRTAAALLPPGAPVRARSAWRAPPSGHGCRARTPAPNGRCGSSGFARCRWPVIH
jgi:integrase